MELQRPDNPARSPGCNRLLKGCVVSVGIMLILFLALVVYVVRMPSLQNVAKCKANIQLVGEALERYRDVTGDYPADLESIAEEYLEDSSVLRCPLCHREAEGASYDYFRPGSRAKDDFVMLQCDLHKPGPAMPVRKIQFLKSGKVNLVTVTPEEITKESRKEQKKGAR